MTSLKPDATADMAATITENTPISLAILFVVAGFIVTAILSFANVSSRVSVLENSQKSADDRLQRIEDKVDRLLERAR